jgi:hypothetical protein
MNFLSQPELGRAPVQRGGCFSEPACFISYLCRRPRRPVYHLPLQCAYDGDSPLKSCVKQTAVSPHILTGIYGIVLSKGGGKLAG